MTLDASASKLQGCAEIDFGLRTLLVGGYRFIVKFDGGRVAEVGDVQRYGD